jgi:hypothetical protein
VNIPEADLYQIKEIYGENGEIIEKLYYLGKFLEKKEAFLPEEKLSSVYFYNISGALIKYEAYNYGEDGERAGTICEEYVYDGEGKKLLSKVLCAYNSDEILIQHERYFFSENGDLRTLTVKKYSEAGKLMASYVQQKSKYPDSVCAVWAFYDENEKIRKRETAETDELGNTRYKNEEFDIKGTVIKSTLEYPDVYNNPVKEELFYDTDGNISHSTKSTHYSSGIGIEEYTYYKTNGKKKTYQKYDSVTKEVTAYFAWLEDGRIKESFNKISYGENVRFEHTLYYDNEPYSVTVYDVDMKKMSVTKIYYHDDNRKIKAKEVFDGCGRLIMWEEYDKKGNVTGQYNAWYE